jgi:hypothetical protein
METDLTGSGLFNDEHLYLSGANTFGSLTSVLVLS